MSGMSPAIPAHNSQLGRRCEVWILAIAFVLVNVVTAATQRPFPFHDREGWEGVNYLAMARQAAEGHFPITGEAPTVFRLGAPVLAGLT